MEQEGGSSRSRRNRAPAYVGMDEAALRVPPHSVEAEQAVLGGLLLDNSTWDSVADRLRADDFYRRDHQLIFEAIAELSARNEPSDAVTLAEYLSAKGQGDDSGGLAYLAGLARDTPTAANIRAYADIVRERSLLRQKGMRMFAILDHGILQNAAAMTLDAPADYKARFGRHPAFVKAKTLAELARKLDMPVANLRRTVADYNRAVDARLDRRWGKQFLIRRIERAPFYAIRAQGITVLSPCGLRVDRQLRVLRPSGRPIPNLYAAGEVLGFERTSGDAFVGGLSLTPALAFGKLLGERLPIG